MIACFDSNKSCNWDELATGCADIIAVNKLEKALSNIKNLREYFKVALVHHHPLPVAASERLVPEGFLERTAGRVLEGAPEFMVFRNAGVFLNRLINQQFNLVLHGHLHHSSNSRYGIVKDGSEWWLEVISARSLGAPPDKQNTFNVIKLFDCGAITAHELANNNDGLVFSERAIELLGYDHRRHLSMGQSQESPNFECDLHFVKIDVILPEGDILITETIRNLRKLGQKDFLTFSTTSPGLTIEEFSAMSLTPGCKAILEPRVLPGTKEIIDKTADVFEYKLSFDPEISKNGVDLCCRWRTYGAMYTSFEAQKKLSIEKPKHHDRWVQNIAFRCKKFMATLQFSLKEFEPENIELVVTDSSDTTALEEKASENVILAFSKGADTGSMEQAAEAILTVIRPKIGFKYGFQWQLPGKDPHVEGDKLEKLRESILNIRHNSTQLKRAVEFLEECLASIVALQNDLDPSHGADAGMHACLFAFDSVTNLLRSTASTNVSCSLVSVEIPWGKDIIGHAFRRGSMCFFDRKRQEGLTQIHNTLPLDLTVVLAIPLYCYAVDGHPSAVLAIASNKKSSELRQFVNTSKESEPLTAKLTERLTVSILKIWTTSFEEILM